MRCGCDARRSSRFQAPKPKGGRPRVSDRAALTGILFVLKTGIPWEYLPAEMGCGSRDDVLAEAAGLVQSRRLASLAPSAARRAGPGRSHRLGRYRPVVERTLSWLNRFRRLKIRYEHRADIHVAFLQRRLAPSSPWVSSANTLVAVLSSDSTRLDVSGSLVIGEDHTV